MEHGNGGATLPGILRRAMGSLGRLVTRRPAVSAHDEDRLCPSCGHLIPAEAAQCGACRAFVTPWIRDADGRWLESDGKGGWRPVARVKSDEWKAL